jgi:hypothetical protein
MHSINISLGFNSLSDKYKNIDKIIFIKDIVIRLLILLHVYQSLLTEDTASHDGIFDLALRIVAPLSFSLVQLSPPLTCENYTVCREIFSHEIFLFAPFFGDTFGLSKSGSANPFESGSYSNPDPEPTWEEITTCQLCEPMTKQTKNVRRSTNELPLS